MLPTTLLGDLSWPGAAGYMAPKKKPRLVDALAEPDSSLALNLLQTWAWGEMNANAVQELASAALQDQKSLLGKVGLNENSASTSLYALAGI